MAIISRTDRTVSRRGGGRNALTIVKQFYPSVAEVNDASKPLHIIVTPRDVNNARRRKHTECALAVACERQFDGAIIARATAYIIKGQVATRYKTGPAIGRELTAYDRGAAFASGEYMLSVPTHKLGDPKGGNSGHTGTKPDTKQFRHVTENIREVIA